ncbi:MAG: hypothetical protein WC614_08275 [bacterium]
MKNILLALIILLASNITSADSSNFPIPNTQLPNDKLPNTQLPNVEHPASLAVNQLPNTLKIICILQCCFMRKKKEH